jgi:two-component system C4-dicarboxylate transport response regulator DctD
MLRERLELLGYEASTAGSGEEATAAMTTARPHVVFLALVMPGTSGLEALTYFREHHRMVPVIVITGSIEHEIARQARAGGAFDVVGKPFDMDVLQGLLARAMQLVPRP